MTLKTLATALGAASALLAASCGDTGFIEARKEATDHQAASARLSAAPSSGGSAFKERPSAELAVVLNLAWAARLSAQPSPPVEPRATTAQAPRPAAPSFQD